MEDLRSGKFGAGKKAVFFGLFGCICDLEIYLSLWLEEVRTRDINSGAISIEKVFRYDHLGSGA